MLRNVPHGSRCAALLACPRAPQRLGARPAPPRPGGVPPAPLVAARPRVTRRPVRDAVPLAVYGTERARPGAPAWAPAPVCGRRVPCASCRCPALATVRGVRRRAPCGARAGSRGGSRVVGRGPGALAAAVACAYIKRLRRKPGDCIQRVVILRFATVISTPRSSRDVLDARDGQNGNAT